MNSERDILKTYGFYNNGMYNALVKVKGYDKPLRGRSEMLVIKGDEVYLCFKDDMNYTVPGGGWEPNEDHKISAQRETQEEVRINTKDVFYAGKYITYDNEPNKCIKNLTTDKNYWWYGDYTEVFIGYYDSEYTGNIKSVDKDDMIECGRFYKISDVIDKLTTPHRNIIEKHFGYFVTESKLTTEERKELPDSSFGLPKQRKFPLNDKDHVMSAIKFFRFAKQTERRELARNIKKAIEKFEMDVNIDKDSLLYKYINPEYTAESVAYFNEYHKTDLTMTYDKVESDIIAKYEGIYNLITAVNITDADRNKLINESHEVHRDNERLNNFVELCIEYDKYENRTNFNIPMINLYIDIFDAINDWHIVKKPNDDLYHAIFEVVRYLLQFINLDHRKFFIRNLYSYCVGLYNQNWSNSIVNLIRENKPEDSGVPDINYVIDILSDYANMPRTTKYLENKVNNFQVYIKDIASIDDYGYPVKNPSLENITKPDVSNLTMMNEAFTIDERGTIRIVLNPRESYMDEYSNCHKILHENYKNKNYEAMKTNLAFMFYLISRIEKDKKYKSRDPQLVKARAFAMNDFKTYLAHLQKHEPEFNFVEYYKQSDIGKYIISIPKETIVGIKKLFQAIIN